MGEIEIPWNQRIDDDPQEHIFLERGCRGYPCHFVQKRCWFQSLCFKERSAQLFQVVMVAVAKGFQVFKNRAQVDQAVADKIGILECIAAPVFGDEQVEDSQDQCDYPVLRYQREEIEYE